MKREEIEQMPAGIETDVQVVELMGWERIDKAIHYRAEMDIRYAIQQDGVWKFQPGLAWLWQPSKDITAAWEVVEKYKSMWTFGYLPNVGVWIVYFTDTVPILEVEAETAPLAICRAALLAVMEP